MPSMPFFPIDTAIVKFIRLRDAERFVHDRGEFHERSKY